MKQNLIEAAKKVFKAKGKDQWWGDSEITEQAEFNFVLYKVVAECDKGRDGSGPYSVWFLLLAAEFSEDN